MPTIRGNAQLIRTSLALVLAIPMWLALSGPATAGELTIVIGEVKETTGKLMIELLPSAEAMSGDGASTAAISLPAAVPVTRITLGDLPAGRYAVRVIQDLDGDGELDSNLVGMPTEPWGFSNGARTRFGPPSFEEAAFTIAATPLSVEIALNH